MTICIASGWRYLQAHERLGKHVLLRVEVWPRCKLGHVLSKALQCIVSWWGAVFAKLLQCSLSVRHRRSAITGATAVLLDARKRRQHCSCLPLVRVEADNNEDRLHLQR